MMEWLGFHPYGDLIDFQSHRKEMGREAVAVPISHRGPEWTFCCFLFSACVSVVQPREPIYCTAGRAGNNQKKKKPYQVRRALKLGGLSQKLHDAQVYLSTSVSEMHFCSDGAPGRKLGRRVDVINRLDEYRSIGR